MSALFAPRINRDREEFEVCDLSSFRIPSTNSLRFPEYDEFGEISDDYNSPPQSPGLLSPHSRPGSVRSTRRRSARDIRIDIEEKGEEKTTCDKIRLVYYKGFHHLAPLFILLIYSAIGAAICQAIELPEEIREHEDMVTKRKLNYEQFKQRMHEIFILDVLTAEKQLNLSLQAVEWFSHQSGLTLPTEEKNYHWTFSGALYYCATIYTTIGYGDIYPRTGTGKTFTVLYAIIGIPMVLAILGDLGKALCRAVSVGWKLLYGFVHNRARVDRQWFNRIVSSQHDQMDIPALLAVGLAVFWIFFVSGLFMIWESWYYSDALYFFFISLTTIGLGDVTPKNHIMMSVCFLFLLLGLALVSMCIQVVQEKIEQILYKMMMMIQEEYQKMLENGEDLSPEEKDNIMKKPAFVRAMMPMVVSNKQTHQLEQHAERSLYAQMDKEVKGVQTDESRVNEKEKIPIINCTTSVQTESPEPTRRDSGVSACSDDEEQLQAFLQTLDPEINYDEIMEYQLALNSPLLMAPNTPLDVITEEDELNESTEMEDSMIVSYIQEGTQTEPTRRKSFSVQMTPISASLTSHQTQTAFLESSEPEECQTDLIQLLSEWVQTDAHQLINTPMQTTQLIMTQDFSQTDLIDLDCSFVQTEEENMFIPELAEHGFQTSRESTPVLEEIASLDKSLQTSLLQLAQLSNRGTQVDLLEALGDESKVLSSSGNQTSVIPTNDEECQTPIVSRKTRASQASIVHPIMSNTEVQARAVADDASIQTSILTLEQSSMQTDDKQLYDTEQQTVNAEWASTFSQTDGDVRRVHDTATTQMQTSATELCSSAAQIKPASSMKSMQTSLQKLDDFATQTGNSLRSLFFSNRSIQYSEEMLQPLLQDQGSVDISPPLTPSPPPPPPKRTKTVWTQTVTRKLPRQERIDTNFVDVEIQTNDSYLKIAKRINALRHNRADSLHIMAAPEVRKYSGQNNRPEQQGPPPEDRSRSRSSGIQGKPKPAAKVNPYNPNNETPTEPDSLHLFVPETIDTTHSPPPSPGLRGTFQKLSFKKRTPSPANNQTPASPSRGESPTASTPPPPVQINDINRKAGPSKMRSFGTIFHAKKKFERGLNGDHV